MGSEPGGSGSTEERFQDPLQTGVASEGGPETKRYETYVAPLKQLGLTDDEARVFVALIEGPLTSRRISETSDLSLRRAADAAKSLEMRGLLKRIPGRPPTFAPIPPRLTLPARVRQQESDIQATRRAVEELVQSFELGANRMETEPFIEVITGREGIRAQCNALEGSAEEEILGMTKLPLLVSSIESGNVQELEAMGRGVRSRWLYERSLLEEPHALAEARRFAENGEEARVIPELPAKMILVDGKTALVHVTESSGHGLEPLGFLTRQPEVVGMLRKMFDLLWAQASPTFVDPSAHPELRNDGGDREIAELLLTGMKDLSIGRHLGVSKRTVARRIRDLLESMKAETRFQAGFKLGYQKARKSPDRLD